MITINQLTKDYPILSKAILDFYRIGIERDSELYSNTKENRRLVELINKKLIDRNVYYNSWVNGFLKKVSLTLKMDVNDATIGFVPNYGGIVPLFAKNYSQSYWQLHFYVSFIRNFFSIQIVELEEKPENGLSSSFIHTKKLIVSPLDNFYVKEFQTVELLIRKTFQNAMFLPFHLDNLSLKGLNTSVCDTGHCEIGKAFFNKAMLPDLNKSSIIIGDKMHGFNDICI